MASGHANSATYFNLSSICQAKGDYKEAISLLNKSIELREDFPDAYTNLGRIYMRIGHNEVALKFILKSLDIKPDNPAALMALGTIYRSLGKPEKAITCMRKSIDLNPDNASAYMNIGGISFELGNLEHALHYTLKSVELRPYNASACMNLGLSYKELGKLDLALEFALKSVALGPENPITHFNAGTIYLEIGNLDKAHDSFLKCLEFNPDDANALQCLGSIYYDQGNLDKALALLNRCLELNCNLSDVYMNLGITYEALNDLDSALDSYSKSFDSFEKRKDESCLSSLISASMILLQTDKMNNAIIYLDRAKKISKNTSSLIRKSFQKNAQHNEGYLSYLEVLVPEIPSLRPSAPNRILHIGESHCLAFTNQLVDIGGDRFCVDPSLVQGAKAFHLSARSRINPQKIAFQKRIQHNRLDDYRYIFLSFGEIDCRKDSGIMPFCAKNDESIDDISRQTAHFYFEWIVNALADNIGKIVFFGVPAPCVSSSSRATPSPEDLKRSRVILMFNKTLRDLCGNEKLPFADVYGLTSSHDGMNNNEWMIDGIHLKPQALKELLDRHIYGISSNYYP